MVYVNILLWVLVLVLIISALWLAIAIAYGDIREERGFNRGRVFEREEKELKFKRTKGTRRVNLDWATLAKNNVVKQPKQKRGK